MWTFPSNASDQTFVHTVKDDLSDWQLNPVIRTLDPGFSSAASHPSGPLRIDRAAAHSRHRV